MTPLSGCVLPVGPRFEDPPSTENVPPFITSTTPPQETVTAVGGTYNFSVTFTDLNADTLYLHWVTEYPPFSTSSHLLGDVPPVVSVNGQPTEGTKGQDINCLNAALALNSPTHPITVFVSDQPFWSVGEPGAPTDPQQILDRNKADSVMAQAHWNLILSCP